MAYFAYLGRESYNEVLADIEATENGVLVFQHLVAVAFKRSYETFAIYVVALLEHVAAAEGLDKDKLERLLAMSRVFATLQQHKDEFLQMDLALDEKQLDEVVKSLAGRNGEFEYRSILPSQPHFVAFEEIVKKQDIDRAYCILYAVFLRLSMDHNNTLPPSCRALSVAAAMTLVLDHKRNVAKAGDEAIADSRAEATA